MQFTLRGLVQSRRAEPGEGFQLAVSGQGRSQKSGDLARFHGLDLRGATHAGNRQAHVDRRPLASEEQVGLQVDLAVGYGYHVGRNVGRHVAELRLDYRQCGK